MMRAYVEKQMTLLLPHLTGCRSLLDFGCGDLSLAKGIKDRLPTITITGVDVVDSGARADGIGFQLYNGKRLPFKNQSFDAAVSYHVFHHCTDPKASFADVLRVTKKKVLMVEPVYRNRVDLFFMKILDRVNNGWRNVSIPMPFTFQKEETWRRWAGANHWTVQTVQTVGVLPAWLPIGVTKLFVFSR